jgi:protein gp37
MWFGVSVEDGTQRSRIEHLRQAPAGLRFLSIEPLHLVCGCDGCSCTIRISGVPKADVIEPHGLELQCPKCRSVIGRLYFHDYRELDAVLIRQ